MEEAKQLYKELSTVFEKPTPSEKEYIPYIPYYPTIPSIPYYPSPYTPYTCNENIHYCNQT
jgi:hypothetical protein